MIGNKLEPFKFWCQKVLPNVYDDSLSYYEYLCKLNEYLNEVIEQINTLTDNMEDYEEDLTATWLETKEYIDNYFDNLDVQQEINNKLDVMAESGALSTLLAPIVGTQIGGVVADQIGTTVANQIGGTVADQIDAVVADQIAVPTATATASWLNAHVDPVGSAVIVDNTLTISGAAADAKTTGDCIKTDEQMIWSITDSKLPCYFTDGSYINGESGEKISVVGWSSTDYIPISLYAEIVCKGGQNIDNNAYYSDKDEETFISGFRIKSTDTVLSIPENAKYMRLSCRNAYVGDFVSKCVYKSIENSWNNNELILKGISSGDISDNFIQVGTENRIWYLPKLLKNGWKIRTNNPDYDVTTFFINHDSYQTHTWAKEYTVDMSEQTDGIAIRKSDRSNISGLTQLQLHSYVKYYLEENPDFEDYKKSKYAHYSFDDCVVWSDLIENENVYNSIFDNNFLSDLKDLHDTYGAVFTLNCFCTNDSYSIENVPSKFAQEFINNKNWLKFAFHAEDSSTYYNTDDVDGITASYNKFTTAIETLCGDLDCIDHVTRLGFFTGTLNNVLAIRDCQCGITGLLCADDTRVSYYLTSDEASYLRNHSKFFDSNNKLELIRTQPRIDTTMNMTNYCNQFLSKAYNNQSRYLEFFTHEYNWSSTIKEQIATLLLFLKLNGYYFDFMENVLKL